MIENQFLAELKEITLELSEEKIDSLSKLRDLERKLELIQIFESWSDKDIKFLAYFVKQTVGIIWRNLAVDSPIDLTDAQLEKICKSIGTFLLEVLTLIEKGKVGNSYRALSSITDEIYKSIIEANKILYKEK
jgi:hypothetical protein